MATLMKRDVASATMSPLTLSTSMLENSNNFNNNNNKNGLLLESSKLKMNIQPSSTTTPTTPNMNNDNNSSTNKLKIRFLIFVEDSDGIRYQIFDSEKNTQITNLNNKQIKLQNNNNSSPTQSFSSPTANSSTTTTTTSPISSKLNNEMLTRMVFGSFPMVVSNRTAIKVHSLKNSNKTMISNVFLHYNTSSSSNNKLNSKVYKCNCKNNNNNNNISNNTMIRRDSIIKINEQDNNNTQPIDIIKSSSKNNNEFNKKLNISVTNVETPTHQSFSSSEIESTTNLSINNQELLLNQQQQQQQQQQLNNSPCSSVPTYYGSYSGIYKRLMRSVSNSLISTATTTNTAVQSNDLNSLVVNLNNSSLHDSINELDSTHTNIENNNSKIRIKRKPSISITSNSSFVSNKNTNSKENMDENVCEKCVS